MQHGPNFLVIVKLTITFQPLEILILWILFHFHLLHRLFHSHIHLLDWLRLNRLHFNLLDRLSFWFKPLWLRVRHRNLVQLPTTHEVTVDDGLGKVHHFLHVRVIVVYLGNQIYLLFDFRWVDTNKKFVVDILPLSLIILRQFVS